MENRFTRTLYDHAPPLARSIGASIFGWTKRRRRFSGSYPKWEALFADAEKWPLDRLRDFQDERLRELVSHAAEHVPYYQSRFAEWGIDPGSIRCVDDLHRLPILEKTDVVQAGDRLISLRYLDKPLNRFPTSGSTGTPLVVPHSEDIEQMEWAFIHGRYLSAETKGAPYSTFTGLELLPPSRTRPPYWVDNWSGRQRMFSIFHMNDETLPHYVEALDRRYSLFYLGYPSAMFTIAEFMVRRGLRLGRPPKFVFGSSEELQPHYESTIREAFGCDVRNRYGQNELAGSITKYECGHLHYDMDYSIMEFLPVETFENGEVLAEVIGTNIHDHAWPLLRYRTGDLVVYHPDDACDCGRAGRVIRRIHGRTGRYFVLPNGSRVTNISVIAKKCSKVRLMQVVQRRAGEIVIRVVRDDGYDSGSESTLLHEFRRKLGNDLAIEIDYVSDIERTPGGKYMSIINEVEDQA